MVGGFCWVLLFLFVPETFWDRTPRPRARHASKNNSMLSVFRNRVASHVSHHLHPQSKTPLLSHQVDGSGSAPLEKTTATQSVTGPALRRPSQVHRHPRSLRVEFAPEDHDSKEKLDNDGTYDGNVSPPNGESQPVAALRMTAASPGKTLDYGLKNLLSNLPKEVHPHSPASVAFHQYQDRVVPAGGAPPTPNLHTFNSPSYGDVERRQSEYFNPGRVSPEMNVDGGVSSLLERHSLARYTTGLKERPRLTFVQQLKPYNGRLHTDAWLKVAIRPFILYAYPAVLWSSIVYACSVGWLIVISESVAVVYRSPTTYGFSALSAGLIYTSPFIGGILGTAVAGKVSDIIVRAMSKRNGGLYEPEFRLVMAAPVALSTVVGLMGFGWSAKVHDAWIVPTIFFGVISFGCSLGSTTAITFCVDSYRQYAGEALVTLNFSKNIFHGLVFSLFFTNWLETDGSKTVFIWVGVIQLILMALTIPMYIFGKRARMWTVRKNLMEKF